MLEGSRNRDQDARPSATNVSADPPAGRSRVATDSLDAPERHSAGPPARRAGMPTEQPFDDLAVVLAGVSAGISVQDASGRLIYVNDVAARMAGFASPG